MRKFWIVSLIVLCGLVTASSQTAPTSPEENKILKGSIVFKTSAETLPEVDALVCVCEDRYNPSTKEHLYVPIATTVSDADGKFALVLANLQPEATYVLRVLPVGGVEYIQPLGTGVQEVDWLKDQAIEITSPRSNLGHLGPLNPRPGETGIFAVKTVLFATDRAVTTSSKPVSISNANSADGSLTYGRCEVVIHAGTYIQKLIDSMIYGESKRYYTVSDLSVGSEQEFDKELSKRIGTSSKHDALLFIHGYNSSFKDACRRAAQIAYDLKFDGPVLLYSWPSHDSLNMYGGDEEMAEWSNLHFRHFLASILQRREIHQLHIVAHSMGNRILAQALYSSALTPQQQSKLGQVVFAAADINRLIFEQAVNTNKCQAQRVTLYVSGRDQALALSQLLHGFSRVGDTRPEVEVLAGIDSVDASAVDSGLLGHGYIGDSHSVLADLAALVSSNTAPDRRLGVSRKGTPPKNWWFIEP